MPRHITITFPGQGSQKENMLMDFDPLLIDDYRHKLTEILDFDLVKLIEDNDPLLNQSTFTQPAILFVSYLHYEELKRKHNIIPSAVCGHSLGEYTALTVAESISLNDALLLVHKRGKLMEKAASGSMYAILNFNYDKIKFICDEVSKEEDSIVTVANINSDKQIVISGSNLSTEKAVEKLKNNGAKRCIKLNVNVPSHSPLMESMMNDFDEELKKIEIKMPKYDLYQNINAGLPSNLDELKSNLKNQLVYPVQWSKTLNNLNKLDSLLVECGPGNVLTGISKSNGIQDFLATSSKKFNDELNGFLTI
tara:strand:- start:8 stop:931 length:924 start_codon:yes stop_codon:yes gene_type:complete